MEKNFKIGIVGAGIQCRCTSIR